MTLKEMLERNKKAQKEQNSLTIEEQIVLLKKHKKSVFTFHMIDGRKIVSGDSESDQKEMKLFFKEHPQKGCERIEFHK